MYSKITNPKTGRKVDLNGRLGKNIVRNYLMVLNGGASAIEDSKVATIWHRPFDTLDVIFIPIPKYVPWRIQKYFKQNLLKTIGYTYAAHQQAKRKSETLKPIDKEKIYESIQLYNQYIHAHIDDIIVIRLPDFPLIIDDTEQTDNEGQTYYKTLKRLQNERLKALLLTPPFDGQHTINMKQSKKWIEHQLTPLRKQAATKIIEHTRYISHTELLYNLELCIDKLFERIGDEKYVLILDNERKSNYWMTMIALYIIKKKQKPMPYDIGVFTYLYKTYNLNVYYVDIDDMAYSGNQTNNSLGRRIGTISEGIFINFFNTIKTYCKDNDLEIFNILNSNRFFNSDLTVDTGVPLSHIINQTNFINILEKYKRYIVIRPFISKTAFELLNVYTNYCVDFIFAEILNNLKDVIEDDIYKIIISLFQCSSDPPPISVYFDHKIADSVSTLLIPLNTGIIPNNEFYNFDNSPPYKIKCKSMLTDMGIFDTEVNAKKTTGIPNSVQLINNCRDYEFEHTEMEDIIVRLDDGDQNLRCPYAYYKKINYDTGKLELDDTGNRGSSRLGRRRRRAAVRQLRAPAEIDVEDL